MKLIEHFPISESVAVMLIFGVFFSLTAYITSKSSVVLFENKPEQKREVLLVSAILIYITLFLTYGGDLIKQVTPQKFLENMRAQEIITISKKLLFFVLIPFIAYKYIYKFNLRDFGLIVKAKELFTLFLGWVVTTQVGVKCLLTKNVLSIIRPSFEVIKEGRILN
jgi:hypothetical protein